MADDDVHPRAGIPLAPLTTLGIGGPADWFVRATSAEQVGAAVRWCRDRELSLFVMGGGSNHVDDDGVKALVLQVAIKGVDFLRRHADIVARVGAGSLGTTWWQRPSGTDSQVLSVYRGSLALGSTPVQNVGAYGQEVSDTITEVEVFDTATMHMTTTSDASPMSVRLPYASRFKSDDSGRFVVCGVQFALRQGSPTITYPDVVDYVQRGRISSPTLDDVRKAVLSIRRGKGMVIDETDPDTRSVGSFFVNPVVTTAVHAGLEAERKGAVRFSHAPRPHQAAGGMAHRTVRFSSRLPVGTRRPVDQASARGHQSRWRHGTRRAATGRADQDTRR